MCTKEIINGSSSERCKKHGWTKHTIVITKNSDSKIIKKEKFCEKCKEEEWIEDDDSSA